MPAVSEAAAALLDRIAIPLDPARLSRLRQRLPSHDGLLWAQRKGEEADCRAWFAGPLHREMIEAAARQTAPLSFLAKRLPGGETPLYALIAAAHGFCFRTDLEDLTPLPTRLPPARVLTALSSYRFLDAAGLPVLVLAPPLEHVEAAVRKLSRTASGAILLTTPRLLQARLAQAIAARTLADSTSRLRRLDPELSAARRPTRLERFSILFLLALIPAGFFSLPALAWALLHLFSALSFTALGYVRYRVLRTPPEERASLSPLPDAALPSYTVLLALYKEAHMVEGLLAALDRLDYPRARLQILLLLEEDDTATRQAAERAIRARPHVTLLRCPDGAPRTKPRALNYGLTFARGDLVTVYDAEDRPHPLQLRQAAAALLSGPPHLACVQARLDIDRTRTPLQRQFALDYLILFHGVLPWLGARRLPLPLGGTSNHFKRKALETAFGWDPFNVTEDADLGLRLLRYGHSVDVIESATLEEAPRHLGVWFNQRTRWLKGWMITYLVHGTRPRLLAREIGLTSSLMVHLFFLAHVLAPLFHPFGLALLFSHLTGVLAWSLGVDFTGALLFAASILGMLFGYGVSLALARVLAKRCGRTDLLPSLWWMPAYWLLVSLAAWRALYQLLTAPHYWAKTPHDAHEEAIAEVSDDR